MQKNLKKIHDFLFYPGVKKTDYIAIRPEIRQENREMTIALSAIASVLIAIMFSISFDKESGVSQNMVVYAVGFAISIAVLTLALTKAKSNDKLILPLMYLAYATYYLYGIFIGAVTDPNGKTVTFIAMLVLMPTLFIDRPIRTIGITALFITIFIVISSFTKSPEVFNVDVIDAVIFGMLGAATGTVRSMKDARAHKTRLECEKLSRIDALTRLNNQSAFLEDIEKISYKKRITCVFIDINDLKEINDHSEGGHQDGDKCIISVANQIKKYFDKYEQFAYRVGGDEFVVFCPELTKRQAQYYVSKIRTALKSGKKPYSIAVGVEEYERSDGELSLLDLKGIADQKMYVDKARHKALSAAKKEDEATITKDR